MIVGAAIVEIRIHGSHSLKQRRGVVRSITRRVSNRYNLSIAEVGGQDTWQRAELGLCSAGTDRQRVRSLIETAVGFIEKLHLAEIVAVDIEVLDLPHESTRWNGESGSVEFEEWSMSRRTERIAEQLRSEIARVLREESNDPRTRLVTLTRVDVAPDLSNALVFWSALDIRGEDSADGTQHALDSAASFVRRHLAQSLPLRRVPALRFRYDPSLALGDQTLSLLRSLADQDDT
jgi:ribosome-binding factor A